MKQYSDNDIADRKESRTMFKIIDDVSLTTIAGNTPAYKGTYTFLKTEDPDKGQTQKVLRLWTLLAGKLYTIAYVSKLDTFDKYKPTAEAIIESISLR